MSSSRLEAIGKYILNVEIKKAKIEGAREFAEWFAECEKVSEPIKEHTINRWLEDFAEWQKRPKDMNKVLGFDAKESLSEYEKMLNSPIGNIIKDL